MIMNGGFHHYYLMKFTVQNNMENATKNILDSSQVWRLRCDLNIDFKLQLIEQHPEVNKYEIRAFIDQVVSTRIEAILCTLNNDAYENIVKVVSDKLNLNDLFDNRQKYLN
jgi:hypothetical protein